MEQPTLFDRSVNAESLGDVALFALGDFQSRGKLLVGRELALDRLLGAFKRAAEALGTGYLSDSEIVSSLRLVGAQVKHLQPFVAKHPFKVIVAPETAQNAASFYRAKLQEIKGLR